MYQNLKFAFNLFDVKTQRKVLIFGICKVFLGLFDLVGILLVGALIARLSGSDFSLPFLSYSLDGLSMVELGTLSAISFVTKSVAALVFTKILINTLVYANANLASSIFEFSLKNITWASKKYSRSELNFLLISTPGAAIEMLLGTITLISETFLLASILVTFIVLNPLVTIFVIIYFLIITLILNRFLGIQIKRYSQSETENAIALTNHIFDSMTAYREIKSLKKERFFLEKFKVARTSFAKTGGNITFLNTLPKNIVEPALMVGALGLIAGLSIGNSSKEVSQSIGIFLAGGLKIMSSLLPIQATFASFSQLSAVLKILQNFVNDSGFNKRTLTSHQSDIQNSTQATKNAVGVLVKDLNFSYERSLPPVLKGVSLEINPGQFVAIIGASGAGKSTFADLIIGIEKPTSGSIEYFNDQNEILNPCDINFGYVAQNPGVISGRIIENIALGIDSDEVDMNKLNSAISKSHLNDVLINLDYGVETDLGKQSDALSGGQLQRIGLARALYANPNLLILDEATSSLDAETEFAVSNSIQSLRGKTTIIVIAHRLTTVQNADVVYLLDEGSIVAQGTFKELLESNEKVAKLVELSEIKTN